MNKTIFGIILCLLLSASVYAQNTTVTIKIIEEETNEPLIGATAYFEVLKIGAITNDEGLVVLDNVPLGEQEITISFVGFET
ncbi:MAG: carboxypeptidase-like regulatory domain-containing protein, partial [Flavobacteriaceae bacterium]|nr:carboxypeptidase-like regulatory domain-containing protein [Flavobacteriaceae bacterium]